MVSGPLLYFIEEDFVFVEVVLQSQAFVGVYRGEDAVRIELLKIGELRGSF